MPDSTMLQSEDLQERYERYKAKIISSCGMY